MIMVEDVLTSYSTTNALSSNMGRVLNESIEILDSRVTTLENNGGGTQTSECKIIIW